MKLKNTMVVILRVLIIVLLLAVVTGNLYARRAVSRSAKQKHHTVKVVKHNKHKNSGKKCAPKKVKKSKKVTKAKKTNKAKKVSYRVPRYRHVMNMRAKAFKASQSPAERAVNNALTFLGTPYSRGGISSRGMDCSGLVYRVMRDMGRNVPHNSSALFNTGIPVSKSQLKKGDLLFFKTTSARIGHVGIYTSNGRFVHASSGAGRVVVTPLSDQYYTNRYVGARRIFNSDGTPAKASVKKAKSSPKATKHKKAKSSKHVKKHTSHKKAKFTKHKATKKSKSKVKTKTKRKHRR